MKNCNLLNVKFQFDRRVWIALGWMDGGIVVGAFGLLVKVGR